MNRIINLSHIQITFINNLASVYILYIIIGAIVLLMTVLFYDHIENFIIDPTFSPHGKRAIIDPIFSPHGKRAIIDPIFSPRTIIDPVYSSRGQTRDKKR